MSAFGSVFDSAMRTGPSWDQYDGRFSGQDFKEIVLEKIRFGLSHCISKAALATFNVREMYRRSADQIVYQIEAYLMGRQAFEKVVERKTETGKTETTSEQRTVMQKVERPATWWDHLKYTFQTFVYKRNLKANSLADFDDDYGYPAWKRWRLGMWAKVWGKLVDRVRDLKIETEWIEVQVIETKVVNVTPVTKYIEVHKHTHICPHLDFNDRASHMVFVAPQNPF